MIIIDTSAWIDFFHGNPSATAVDKVLADDDVGIGDIIYLEIMQGIRSEKQRNQVSQLLLDLPGFNMVGFYLAEKSAENYRFLRSKGVTVRKTIDVMIATFCIEHGFSLLHNDRDFDHIAQHLGLKCV